MSTVKNKVDIIMSSAQEKKVAGLIGKIVKRMPKVEKSKDIRENLSNRYYHAKMNEYIIITAGSPFVDKIVPALKDLALSEASTCCPRNMQKLDYTNELYELMYKYSKKYINGVNEVHQNKDSFHEDVNKHILSDYSKEIIEKIWELVANRSYDYDSEKLDFIEELITLLDISKTK